MSSRDLREIQQHGLRDHWAGESGVTTSWPHPQQHRWPQVR
jgi:hypothetical protein